MATNFINPNAVHMVAGSSKLKATQCGHIYNIFAPEDMDNGCIVGVGSYERPEVYNAKDPTEFAGQLMGKASNGNYLVEVTSAKNANLVLTSPMTYWENPSYLADEKYFYNAKGDIMRCYELVTGDVFEISDIICDSEAQLVKGAILGLEGYKVAVNE